MDENIVQHLTGDPIYGRAIMFLRSTIHPDFSIPSGQPVLGLADEKTVAIAKLAYALRKVMVKKLNDYFIDDMIKGPAIHLPIRSRQEIDYRIEDVVRGTPIIPEAIKALGHYKNNCP